MAAASSERAWEEMRRQGWGARQGTDEDFANAGYAKPADFPPNSHAQKAGHDAASRVVPSEGPFNFPAVTEDRHSHTHPDNGSADSERGGDVFHTDTAVS